MRARAMELLRYDVESGDLFWRVSRGRVKAGRVAGSVNYRGYRSVKVDGRDCLAHRLIWLMAHGQMPEADIDHIDGDRLNNRLENLREATRAENGQNVGVQSNNTSGFTGVTWHKGAKKWKAQIGVSRRYKAIGYFDTPEQAAEAYAKAKARLHRFHPDAVTRKAAVRVEA